MIYIHNDIYFIIIKDIYIFHCILSYIKKKETLSFNINEYLHEIQRNIRNYFRQ